MDKKPDIHIMTDHLFRENYGKMVAVLTRSFSLRQIETIVDAVQDTFEAALLTWRYSGIPANPEGWLMKVARNKVLSALRRNTKTDLVSPSAFISHFDEGSEQGSGYVLFPHEVEDSQLRLLLTCCHPDFSERNQIIITLHILCGFGVSEIAGALLMDTEAVKKALSRIKAELKEKGDILLTPQLPRYEKRVETVHTILYLMYNEGYKTSRAKEMIDHGLCYEAMRLTKLLLNKGVALTEETHALLALMFFNLARFPSRLSSDGEIITLAEQDRGKWNSFFIEEGYYHLNRAPRENKLSRYYLEAIIASLHCTAKSFGDTNWKVIVKLYQQLETIVDSPIITLNKIVAESYLHDPLISLGELDKLKKQKVLKKYYLVYAAEGDMFLRMNNAGKARISFEKALTLATSPLDKQFLSIKIAQC